MSDAVLIILGVLSLASALGVIASPGAVYSALSLTVNLIVMAVFFLFLGAQFLALTQVLVYAGAVMVLFLFAVTLLAPREEPIFRLTGNLQRLLGVFLGCVLGLVLASVMTRYPYVPGLDKPFFGGTIHLFATQLAGPFLLPFEATTFVLLVALMGAVVLGKRELGRERDGR